MFAIYIFADIKYVNIPRENKSTSKPVMGEIDTLQNAKVKVTPKGELTVIGDPLDMDSEDEPTLPGLNPKPKRVFKKKAPSKKRVVKKVKRMQGKGPKNKRKV